MLFVYPAIRSGFIRQCVFLKVVLDNLSAINQWGHSSGGKLLHRTNNAGEINYIFLGNKLVAKAGTGITASDDSLMHYKPFGESIEEPKDDVGYTGHKFDKELGLSYMQARYYDPVIGRFYSNDPVGTLGHLQRGNSIAHGFNRYAYANNNPYKYTDPDGEFAFLAPLIPYVPAAISAGKAALGIGAVVGTVAGMESAFDQIGQMNESSDSENKGQTKPEVGDCPTCGGDTSNKPGKIGDAHGLKPKEVKEAIHGVKGNANLPNNPDVEVCNDCGEVFPQTEDGSLGDSIGNIEDEKGN